MKIAAPLSLTGDLLDARLKFHFLSPVVGARDGRAPTVGYQPTTAPKRDTLRLSGGNCIILYHILHYQNFSFVEVLPDS